MKVSLSQVVVEDDEMFLQFQQEDARGTDANDSVTSAVKSAPTCLAQQTVPLTFSCVRDGITFDQSYINFHRRFL